MDSKWTYIPDHSWQQQLGKSCCSLHSGTVLAVPVNFAWPHQWLQICTAEKQPLVRGRQEWRQQEQSVKYEALSKLGNFNLAQSVFLFPTVPSLKFPTAWTVSTDAVGCFYPGKGQMDPWEASEPILPHIFIACVHKHTCNVRLHFLPRYPTDQMHAVCCWYRLYLLPAARS